MENAMNRRSFVKGAAAALAGTGLAASATVALADEPAADEAATDDIAWEAEAAGIDVCPHAWLTDLLTAASLHANAALPRSLFLEYNVSESAMLRDVIQNPIRLLPDGTMAVPQSPGLGIEIDEKAVLHYQVQ